MARRPIACLALALAACTASTASPGGDAGDASLPDSFGDCDAAVCEVALPAFTSSPGSIPYCPPDRASLDLSCSGNRGLLGATCAGLWTIRTVYGFPGDFYECSYDAATGALIGAKWAPDNHPVQIAGTQLATACTLGDLCPDAGGD